MMVVVVVMMMMMMMTMMMKYDEYIRDEICLFCDSSLDWGINALILKGLGVLAPLVGQLDDG